MYESVLRLCKTYQSQAVSITKKTERCVRDSRRTFSDLEQSILVANCKDEERQAHISKVSIEVDGPSQETRHYVVKDNFKNRKGA